MPKLCAVLLGCLLLGWTSLAAACAFEDTNNDQVFNGADVLIPDAAWLGGAAFVTGNGFVLPAGCTKVVAGGLAVTNGVRVTAAGVAIFGNLDYLAPGGRGVVFLSTGDLQVGNGIVPARIRAGGVNTLPANSIALYRRSIALSGAGQCDFFNAEIRTNVPLGSTAVGILCQGNMTFRGSQVVGSKVNIQSLAGFIDGGTGASGGGGGFFSLAALCDNPAFNLTGNGDSSNSITPGDFPCSLNLGGIVDFADATELASACTRSADSGPPPTNQFFAFNDPLIFIAGAGGVVNTLDLTSAQLVGRYRVTLAAEDSGINTTGAIIDHGQQLGLSPPGGAKIWVFADPTSVVRLPVDREDFFGPSTASTIIQDACYRSPNPINVGRDAALAINLVGTPLPAPCAQLPDFVGVQNGLF